MPPPSCPMPIIHLSLKEYYGLQNYPNSKTLLSVKPVTCEYVTENVCILHSSQRWKLLCLSSSLLNHIQQFKQRIRKSWTKSRIQFCLHSSPVFVPKDCFYLSLLATSSHFCLIVPPSDLERIRLVCLGTFKKNTSLWTWNIISPHRF